MTSHTDDVTTSKNSGRLKRTAMAGRSRQFYEVVDSRFASLSFDFLWS
jgi:hypothetical protein